MRIAAIIIIGLLIFAYVTDPMNQPIEAPYTRGCTDPIDFDWVNQRQICPCDTATMMRNPYARGWILKKDYKYIPRRKSNDLPMTEMEEFKELLDEYGVEEIEFILEDYDDFQDR